MTFKVYGEIEIDGKMAKVEIKGVDDALKKAAGGADKFTFSGKGAAKGAEGLGKQSNFAAGAVGNLTAQGNDVITMLFAMQNPMQLAIQQGTQITQVFGNRGAAQAGTMLKQALLSMVSPLNLITIGGLAAGAALLQWGIRAATAGEETRTFEETIDDLEAAMTAYQQAADLSTLSTAELEEKFGTASAGLRTSLQLLSEIARSEAQQAIDDTAQSLSNLFEIRGDGDQRTALADFFDVNIGLAGFGKASREARDQARELTAEFRNQQIELKQANGDLDAQIDILTRMLSTTQALAEAKDGVSDAEEQVIKQIAESLQKMEQQRAKVADVESATLGLVDAVYEIGVGISTAIGPTDDLLARMTSLADTAWDAAAGFGAYIREQGKQVSGLNGGPDAARLGVQDELLPSGLRRDDVISQFTVSSRTPSRRRSGGGGGRSGGGAAVSSIDTERDAVKDLIDTLQEQLDIIRETDPIQKEMIRNRETLKAATDAERKSVANLIAERIAEEAAIETATERAEAFKDASYDALDGLILRGEKGKDVIANLADALAQAALQSALLGTGPLAGLFGTSGGGGLLGMAAGFLFPDAAPAQADGGLQYGPGGPRDDLLPRWLSAGEYVVNANATAQNLALLEYINNGGLIGSRGMADGGRAMPVSMPTGVGPSAGGAGRLVVRIALDDQMLNARVVEVSQGVMVEGLEDYRANGLPSDITEISADPARIG